MKILAIAVLAAISLTPKVKASSALASSISCMDANGVPATVVKTKSGKQVQQSVMAKVQENKQEGQSTTTSRFLKKKGEVLKKKG